MVTSRDYHLSTWIITTCVNVSPKQLQGILCDRDGQLWKYESVIIVCASITVIAIIGYLTYVCRFPSTIKLIPFICWVNSVENWFRCDSTENLKLWHNNHYFCDHDMAIFRQYDYQDNQNIAHPYFVTWFVLITRHKHHKFHILGSNFLHTKSL